MKVGPYELGTELARGDRSVTHRARAPGGGEVALTLVRSDSQAFERFQQERAVLDGLTLADGFVPVVDAGTSDSGAYLVQPLLAGGTFRDSMRAHPMPQGDVVRLVRGLASALARAHDRGLVHGELSPGSVVLSEGQPFITDLALARYFSADPAARNPTYAAPEARTGAPTERSDVFSLGVVLKEMLGSEPPRREVARALERACAADPADRFEDARVFLRAIGGGVGPAVHAPTRVDSDTRSGATLEIPAPSRSSARWVSLALLAFLLVAAGTVLGLHALDVHKTEELELGFLDAASRKDRKPAELLRTAERFPPRVRSRPAVQATIASLASEVQVAESRVRLAALVASFHEDSKGAARLDAAEKALALDPRCAPALLARARARLEVGRKDTATLVESRKAARADLERAIECDRSLAAAHFELAALLALSPNDRKRAQEEFEAARSIEPDSTLGLVAAGEAALIAGNLRQTETAFEAAVAKKPETALAYLARARTKLELDVDWPGALDDAGHAVALAPASAEAHLLRGWALSRMTNPPQPPLEELDKAIALDPQLAEAFARRAMVRHRAGDAPGGQSDINESGRLDVDVAIGWLAGAELNAFVPAHSELHHERERLERAHQFLDQAIARKPHLFQAIFDEVLVLVTVGDAKGALAWCDRGLGMQPRHPDLLFHRAVQLMVSGQGEEARAAFDRAVEAAPDQPAVHFWRGKFRVEVAPQNFPGAVEDMTKVLEIEANVPDAHFIRGVALQNLGRYQDAIADYDATEHMAPNAPYIPNLRKLREDARAALAR